MESMCSCPTSHSRHGHAVGIAGGAGSGHGCGQQAQGGDGPQIVAQMRIAGDDEAPEQQYMRTVPVLCCLPCLHTCKAVAKRIRIKGA